MNRRAFALLLLVFGLLPLPSLSANADAVEITQRIKQLGSEDYDEARRGQ